MVRLIPTFALAAVLVASPGTSAQDEKKEKAAAPAGVWTRTADGIEVKIDFTAGKGTFKASITKGDVGCYATCKYEVKDGKVSGEVTKVEARGDFPNPPGEGFEFGFKWAAKGDAAELSDLTGNFADAARPLIEGEYTRAKDKK